MPHVRLVWERLEGRLGEYRHETLTIVLDPRMRPRQRRSTLSHELVHAERGDVPALCPVAHAKQEAQAERESARRLISIGDLADAVLWSEDLYELAEQLRVDVATIRARLEHLHPAERHYLRRVVATKEDS